MTWVAHLVQTMTGQLGARLDITPDGSWTIPVVGIEDWTVTVEKAQLRRIPRERWEQWRASVMVAWERPDGTLVPWVMGPVVGPPDETRTTATLSCKGLGALLERRVVLDRDYRVDEMDAARASVVRRSGMSLGTIAQDVTKYALAKTGGYVPVRYGSPRETGSALNERTYEGFNLANNGAWKRLTELAEVTRGPDIQFRPAWTDDTCTMLEWVMVHGTAAQPSIAQTWTMDLDATAARSPVANLSVTTDASALTTRVYWTGAGEGAGVLVRAVEDRDRLAGHMPLLESVGATSDTENPGLLVEHAGAALSAGARPVQQITVTIDGADPRCQIGRWRVGDTARLTIGDDWLTVPPGTRPMKIIAAKGSWASSMVDLEFQEQPQETA